MVILSTCYAIENSDLNVDFQSPLDSHLIRINMGIRLSKTDINVYQIDSALRSVCFAGRQQEALAMQAGFRKAVHYEIAFGLMGILVAQV